MRHFAPTMREIVIDTETTGLDPLSGDRVVEIWAVELVNRSLTGHAFHATLPAKALCQPTRSRCVACRQSSWPTPLFGASRRRFLAFVMRRLWLTTRALTLPLSMPS